VSVTIYARAERATPLTEDERRDLAALVRAWSVAEDCAAFQRTARGWNGEDLLVGEVELRFRDAVRILADRLAKPLTF
jgi:hypothetical protein